MHHQLQAFIEQFEREALLNGSYRRKLGKAEISFLEKVWGPAFQYNFEGLKAEYPFKDAKGGQRFADFVYVRNGIRLLIEIDDFTSHAREISPGDFDDHLSRQNDMILSGWLVLRFSGRQVEKRPQICQRQLKQAVGHWWSLTQGNHSLNEREKWSLRTRRIVQIAAQRNGTVKPAEVAADFGVSNRSAAMWMKRLSEEGVFESQKEQLRTRHYRLRGYL